MRLNDDKMQAAREARIRAIVREEIVAALQVLGRSADHEYHSTESEIAERAAMVLESVAESTVHRLTCPHEKYGSWATRQPVCNRCGEPEPEPVNPFEVPSDGKVRQCPVDPSCEPLTGWRAFCEHVYEVHTEGDEADRLETVDRLLKQGGHNHG